MKPLIALTISATKRYLRTGAAWVFSLLVPLFLIGIFGLFSGGSSQFSLGLINNSKNDSAKEFVNLLYCSNPVDCNKDDKEKTKNSAFKITEENEDSLKTKLRKGDLSAILIIPENFNPKDLSELKLLKNQGKQQETSSMSLIISQMVDQLYNIKPEDRKVSVKFEDFESKNLTLIDFLIPGILGINIMNLGLFSVAFAFVSQKSTGVLKRLLATPITGSQIILSEGFSKFVVALLQVMIFIGIGTIFFNLKVQGSLLSVFAICVPAIIAFLAMGFGIAGFSKDENQVAPLAQLVNLPMTFLSGAFFPRDVFPAWLKTITDFFPLTYLNDALRNIMNNGASLWDVRGQLLGLCIWAVICVLIAFRVFRWK